MEERSKTDSPIIVTVACTDEGKAQATLNPAVVDAVFGVNIRHLHFNDELGKWWMRVDASHASYESAKLAALAAMTFLASEQGVNDESWTDHVRLVVLGRSLETGLRPMRDMYVSLFPNAVFHGGRFGEASEQIWGEDFVGTTPLTGEPPVEEWFKNISIRDLGLRPHTYSCLTKVKIYTIDHLVGLTEEVLLQIPNFGKKSVGDVIERLAVRNLKLAES